MWIVSPFKRNLCCCVRNPYVFPGQMNLFSIYPRPGITEYISDINSNIPEISDPPNYIFKPEKYSLTFRYIDISTGVYIFHNFFFGKKKIRHRNLFISFWYFFLKFFYFPLTSFIFSNSANKTLINASIYTFKKKIMRVEENYFLLNIYPWILNSQAGFSKYDGLYFSFFVGNCFS